MPRKHLHAQIVEQVSTLPQEQQRRVLEFARALHQSRPVGVTWDELLPFAG